MRQKIFSAFLAVMMAVQLLPAAAFASGDASSVYVQTESSSTSTISDEKTAESTGTETTGSSSTETASSSSAETASSSSTETASSSSAETASSSSAETASSSSTETVSSSNTETPESSEEDVPEELPAEDATDGAPSVPEELLNDYGAAWDAWENVWSLRTENALPDEAGIPVNTAYNSTAATDSVTVPQAEDGRVRVTLSAQDGEVRLSAQAGDAGLPEYFLMTLRAENSEEVLAAVQTASDAGALDVSALESGSYVLRVQYEESGAAVGWEVGLTVSDGAAQFTRAGGYDANVRALEILEEQYQSGALTFDAEAYGGQDAIAEIAQTAGQLTEGCTNDVQKVRAVYEWITANIAYDAAAEDNDALSVFASRRGTSAGFANLTELMLRAAGLPAARIAGTGESGAHVWNAVRADGTWYMLDTAWDAADAASGQAGVLFLCPAQESFALTHASAMVLGSAAQEQKDDFDWSQQNGLFSHDGKLYYYSAKGVPAPEGWLRIGTKTYYILSKGQVQTGLVSVGDWWYYFDPSTGEMQYGIRKINGKLYSFSQYDGHLVGGWCYYGDGNISYAAYNGVVQTGFQKIDGKWYYISPTTGVLQFGKQKIGSNYYYFNSDGVLQTGWVRAGTKTYYTDFAGVLQSGLMPVGDWWYYFDPSTYEMQYGIRKINGKLYSFSQYDGHLVGGWCYYADGNVTYAAYSGVVQTGFQKIDGKTYYFNPTTGLMTTGFATIDGKQYLFNTDGVLIENDRAGWVRIGTKTYYVQENGTLLSGLVPVGDWWYYFDPSTYEMQYGIRKINGNLYSFSQYDGHLVGGWSYYADGNVSYAAYNGVIQTGFQQIGEKWYYFSPTTGLMQRGIQTIGSKRYYFNNDGVLQTGWIQVGSDTYYGSFDGSFVTGEQTIGNIVYVFDSDGRLISQKTVQAIDVSAHQGKIDWEAVKASGIDYAILRVITWSGNAETGGYVEDAYFDYNMRAAKAAGIKVGAYIYTYAFNEAEVQQEVTAFLNVANRLKADGYTFDLPVFVDHEYSKILTAVPSKDRRTDLLRYEMVMLEQSGYYPGMYMSTLWAQNNVNAAQLQSEGYDLWIADYRGYNGYGNSVVMWQYTSTGSVPGISGNVDVNYLYKDYSGLINGSDNTGQEPTTTQYTVYDQATGKNVTASRLDILAGIVNNEVGGTALTGFDAEKLYKAQAVAANSWLQYTYQNSNTLPSVRLKTTGNYAAVRSAIADVENMVLMYNGKVANTVYGSCSNGTTNSSQDYWGTAVPYLTNVKSSYESVYASAYLPKTTTVSEATVKQKLIALTGVDASAQYSPDKWITITSRSSAGYVTGLSIWGRTVKVSEFKECGLGVPSPDFTVTYQNGNFVFKSYGNGHCVGMSQYGAMGMIAKVDGCTWQGVLSTYYPGTRLTTLA